MGNKGSKLPERELKHLKETTYFDRRELRKWFRDFMKDCPSGMLHQDEFERIYQQFFPFGDPSQFAGFVFKVFDEDGNGYISFTEFITALSITSRGTLDEKLEWAFKLYDVDKSGFITRDHMLLIVKSIYSMVGKMVDLPDDENTPEKRVNKIFTKMDINQDYELSLEEFKEGSKYDAWILQALAIDLPEQERPHASFSIGRNDSSTGEDDRNI